MAARKRSYSAMADINITSLVDVTLCLLIIFMLTAPYIQGGVEVNLPEAATRSVVVKEGPVISITDGRKVFFQEQAVEIGRPGRCCWPPTRRRRTRCRSICAATKRCPTVSS